MFRISPQLLLQRSRDRPRHGQHPDLHARRGIVLDEPSVVAIRQQGGSIPRKSSRLVGKDAKQMLGKVPGTIEAIRPMKDGVIADFTVTEQMLKQFIKMVHDTKLLRPSPRIIISVPCGSTQVERRAIQESAQVAGASQVYLIEEPMARPHSARASPVSEPSRLDAVWMSAAVRLRWGSPRWAAWSTRARYAWAATDRPVVNYIRRNYGMLIGERTAEAIKKEIGSAFPDSEIREMEVKGRNLSERIPRPFTISSNEILEALTDPLNQIVSVQSRSRSNRPSPESRDADIAGAA
ncbi:rod shape-determining protein [Cupriavidus basilensis]